MLGFGKRKRTKKSVVLQEDPVTSQKNGELAEDLSANEQVIREMFSNCSDFQLRVIPLTSQSQIILVSLQGLSDTNTLEKVLLEPMIYEGFPGDEDPHKGVKKLIEQKLIAVTAVNSAKTYKDLADGILMGYIGILVSGESEALLAVLQGYEKRSIQEPTAEVAIRGPKDSFTEDILTNTSLIRRRIRSTKLKFEAFSIGEYSKTDVRMAYIEGIAKESLVSEIKKRIERIQVSGVLDAEIIEEFIEDMPYSPFPQVQNTERPDVVVSNLLEGRAAILVDNSPFTLVVPMTFWAGLQAAEDYYERFLYSSFIRLVRLLLFNISLFLPSLYVALTTYHPKLLPTNLLISIAAAREGVPFPAMIEAFMMELNFEGLREAGIRLPKAIGQAVSIVGAIVIGQASVQAGIVSAPMVIVVALTGIASFTIPRYNMGFAVRMLRFIVLICAGLLGLYGIVLCYIALTIHLVNLRSFGVPYYSPVAPMIPSELKDVFIRVPRWSMQFRPYFTTDNAQKRVVNPNDKQADEPDQGENET